MGKTKGTANQSLSPAEDAFEAFHAGEFLKTALDASGHDIGWLAAQTGEKQTEIERLFSLANMDAELFVRIGYPMGSFFFDRVHEAIFCQ